MNYKYCLDENSENRTDIIIRIDHNDVVSIVPNDDDNFDWRRYQEWLALGNTPQAGDPLPEEEI